MPRTDAVTQISRAAHSPGAQRVRRLLWRAGAQIAALLLRPVAGILFMRSAASGAILLLVLAMQPRLAIAGAFGLAVGEALRRLLGVEETSGLEGCVKANAFLSAVAIGWLTQHAGLTLFAEAMLIGGAAALAAILAAAIRRALLNTILPPLACAYCVSAAVFYLLFPEWAARTIVTMPWGGPPVGALDWLMALLRSLGAFMFTPTPLAGLLIAAALLWWSPVAFLYGLIGWIAGVVTAVGFLRLGEIYYWLPVSYNFFIAGMALGAAQFLPSRGGLAIAAAAGAIASVAAIGLQELFAFSPVAFLPIASGLTIWVGIGALHAATQRGLVWINREQDLPPEEAWRRHAFHARRWGHEETLLAVPVGGALEVTQGFSGRLSHAGAWRHALDLQRPRRDDALEAARASIWGAAVYTPAPGYVERIRNDVPDNPLGRSNFADNWGNHVILRLDQGYWAMLAHLQQGSVAVFPGQRVEFGSFIGLVGNSGRSPAPHLHLQAQRAADSGAPTRRFRLINFLTASGADGAFLRWHPAGNPAKGTILAVAWPNPAIHALLAGMAPGRSVWSVDRTGNVPRAFGTSGIASLAMDTSLDTAGRLQYRDETGGALISRFDGDAWRMVEATSRLSPLLALLAFALPSVPYAAVPDMVWTDVSPASAARTLFGLANAIQPFSGDGFVALQCQCLSAPAAGSLTIETRPPAGAAGLPASMTVIIDPVRGPVHLTATFRAGSIAFSALSFAPALPLQGNRNA